MGGTGLKIGGRDRAVILEPDPDLVRGERHPQTGCLHERFFHGPKLEESFDGALAQPKALFREEKFTGDPEGGEGGVDGLDVEADAAVPRTNRQRDPLPGVGEVKISARVIRQKGAAMGGDRKGECGCWNLEIVGQLLFDPGAAVDPAMPVVFKMEARRPGLLDPREQGDLFRRRGA